MTPIYNISEQYLDALSKGDSAKAKSLFAEGAQVDSPLYGLLSADTFFDELELDTVQSKVSEECIFTNEDQRRAAVHFKFDWTLQSGVELLLEVVEILQFNEAHQIEYISIVYDTVDTRKALGTQIV